MALVLLSASLLLLPEARADRSHSGVMVTDASQNIYFEQFSSNTYGLQVLQARDKFDYKTLVLGGMAEADLQYWQGDKILISLPQYYQRDYGGYLTQISLDFMANITPWATLFISPAESQIGQGGSNGNYFYYAHMFINIGNLNYSPFYLTVGINNIPFGIFTGSGTWDTPLTNAYFNPLLGPQVTLGFYKNNLNINVLEYKDEVNYEYHFASSLSYNNTVGAFSYGVGAGYLTQLKTNSTGNVGSVNQRRNTASIDNLGEVWDANAGVGYSIVSLRGEFLAASNKIPTATSKPAAYSVTLSLTPTLLEKVTTFGINHSVSYNLQNVPATLPGQDATQLNSTGLKSMWAMSVSRSIYKDNFTIGIDAVKALTYDHLKTYAYTIDLTAYI